MNFLQLFSLSVFSLTCFAAKPPQVPKTLPGGWKLVWHDEFSGEKLNKKYWQYELGVVRNLKSAQTYTDRKKNVRLEKGFLVIETHHETYPNCNYREGATDWVHGTKDRPYTSGSITSKDRKHFHYGRLEFRAKIPKAKGVWPAIWTLHRNRWGWPANGEIDILEHISQEANTCYSVFRWGENGTQKEKTIVKKTHLPDYSKDFHLYALEWDENMMRILIDEKEIGRIDLNQANYPNGENPLRTPCYLILNTALGGTWCEMPPEDGANYPVRFYIDYVRFYQKKEHRQAAQKTDPQTGKIKSTSTPEVPNKS